MSNNANKRAALTEVIMATTLTAIGLSTGQTPLVGLANIGAAIGSSWGASLLEKSYQNWSRQWFGKNGVLDDDISRALIHALQKAVKELEPELKEHQFYKRLKLYNRETANILLASLVAIGDDADRIVQNNPAMPQYVTSLMAGDQSQLDTQLARIVKNQLFGHPSEFVDLTNLIRKRLTERWLSHFHKILNEPTELGTKARSACQRLWQQSLSQALNQIGQDVAEMKNALDWLKASAERQRTEHKQRHPTLEVFIQALENVLEQRLSNIEDNTIEIKQDTKVIRTDTGEIKAGIKTVQEQIERLVTVSSQQNAIVEEASTELLPAPTQKTQMQIKVVPPMNQFDKLRDWLDDLVDAEFRDMMRSLLSPREQNRLPAPLRLIDRGAFLGQMQIYRRFDRVEHYLCQKYPERFSC